jgi:mRNA interferase MazF
MVRIFTMANPPHTSPRRGEVWRVDLDPTRGSEQTKTRPVVVMSEQGVGRATMRVCVPITNWQSPHTVMFWCWPLSPDTKNGLGKDSSADASQVRSLDVTRFLGYMGELDALDVEAMVEAVALAIGDQAQV